MHIVEIDYVIVMPCNVSDLYMRIKVIVGTAKCPTMPDLADLWPSVAASNGQIELQKWPWPWWPYQVLHPWVGRMSGTPSKTPLSTIFRLDLWVTCGS